MKQMVEIIRSKREYLVVYVLLFIISIIPLIGFMQSQFPATHDGRDHIARIANFYDSLADGNIVPRWAGKLNWGYGHPILMFLYPLSSYTASLFHFLGFSFIDSTRLVFIVAYIASIFTMYLWAKEQFGKYPGFFAAVLYGYAPYRFVDLYVRGAIGEHMAFVFPPLVLFFMLKLSKRLEGGSKKTEGKQSRMLALFRSLQMSNFSGVGLAVSMAGMILAHNAISLMFLPVFGLYILYLYYFETNRNPYYLLLTTCYLLLGFMLSSFFWIPALIEGKYTLRDIVTKGEYTKRFVPFGKLLYTKWNYGGEFDLSKEVGFLHWASVLGSIGLFIKTKEKKLRVFILGALGVFVASILIQLTPSLYIWNTVTILQKFQFPWRFLTISMFIGSVLGALVLSRLTKHTKTVVIVLTIGVLVFSSRMYRPNGYLSFPESYYTSVFESTTDTGESGPIWSVRFMEDYPSAPLEVVDGAATIEERYRNSVIHEYGVNATKKTLLVENTLYFPGWNIEVDGERVPIEFQNPQYRGLMTFYVDEGQHDVRVVFGDTKVRQYSNYLSIVGGVLVLMMLFINKKNNEQNV